MDVARAVYQEGLSVGHPLPLDAPPDGFLRCPQCGQLAKRKSRVQVTCGAQLCGRRWQYERERRSKDYREANRRRCAAWYQEHKAEHIAKVGARRRRTYGGAAGPWFATPHAVERWREHYDRDATTYEEALGHLLRECDGAHFVKALETGPQLWRGPKPRRARFVVSVCSEGELPALVTVLPPFDGWRR